STSRRRGGSSWTACPSAACARTSGARTWPERSRTSSASSSRPSPRAAGAADGAGATAGVPRLPAGLATQLGPTWPGGVEVSFGQWQKIALARGFMREAPLVLVLDEPTSALDAETEHALFERYAAAARGTAERASGNGSGRITILVSHRFSTVRMADRIVVIEGARVAQVGSHAELMA